MSRRRTRSEDGVALILFALILPVLCLFAAFSVDMGWWYDRSQRIQRTADAAALAGTVWMPNDFANATAVARTVAAANGYVHGVDGVVVSTSVGSNTRQLVVTIRDPRVKRFFSRVVNTSDVSIGRAATGQYDLPVPLGSPENQFGGGNRGVYLAVNSYCAARESGDQYSPGFERNDGLTGNTNCYAPWATALPTGATVKNSLYRPAGYTYVVSVPPAVTGAACTSANPPIGCTTTAADVKVELREPEYNTDTNGTGGDLPTAGAGSGTCHKNGTAQASFSPDNRTTVFSVYGADNTALDDTDNPLRHGPVTFGSITSSTAPLYQSFYTIPGGSLAGRYFVKVHSGNDECSNRWTNVFGIRAYAGATFSACTTIVGALGYSAACPQVHGYDTISVKMSVGGGSTSCLDGYSALSGNKCNAFYLAQVDPVYAGRPMVISLYDPGEGARFVRLIGPDGKRTAFTWATVDSGLARTGSVNATDNGLDVAVSPTFNGRFLQLSLTLPSSAILSQGGSWYQVEYEVDEDSADLTDRTTWTVNVIGSPVHLVS